MATNRGKIHGGKSVLNVHVASDEFGEITRGETTRFYCISSLMNNINFFRASLSLRGGGLSKPNEPPPLDPPLLMLTRLLCCYEHLNMV